MSPSASSSRSPAASSNKTNDTPVYFYRPTQGGSGYLSQWYWSPFTYKGETYHTAEMWMMVQKARLFGDEAVAAKMLATSDPKTHKRLGREVEGFDGRVWDAHKMAIVTEGTMHKFTISDDADTLRGMLLATGERYLVEASPMDRIWGIGFSASEAGRNRSRWGQNLLGKALVDVRARLREKEGKKEEGVDK